MHVIFISAGFSILQVCDAETTTADICSVYGTSYGENAFEFRIVAVCAEVDLFFYEQRFLNVFKPSYNVNPSASGTRGLKWTREARVKQSRRQQEPEFKVRHAQAVSKGVRENTTAEQRRQTAITARASWTEESRLSQIEKLTGRKDSPETIARKVTRLTGRPVSGATRKKLAAQAGWKHSEEAKIKMRGRVFSDKHRERLAASQVGKQGHWRGRLRSEETRRKISATLAGRPRSLESIVKQRAANAARRASVAHEYEES